MLKKVLLKVKQEIMRNLLLKKECLKKNLSEKVGSDKGKLVPTDIGMIVTDFLGESF